jgi:hypothetical protein
MADVQRTDDASARCPELVVTDMSASTETSRISKLFVDRDQTSPAEVLSRRQSHLVTLMCGADIGRSYTLQVAVLTAASIAVRCFPNAVRVALPASLKGSPLLVWPTLGWTFDRALADIVGADAILDAALGSPAGSVVGFGDFIPNRNSLRVTFDGWIAKVGPATQVPRLAEREHSPLAGMLGASLALSELFLSFARVNVVASRRPVALSLWRPDLNAGDPNALGVPVEFLPKDLWALGLGHLGNAYLWGLSILPYRDPAETEFMLMDFDKVEKENAETGLLFHASDEHHYKAQVCSKWLGLRGIRTRLVERRFDGHFRLQEKEPSLALCGFDSNPARRCLATADFSHVVESGLGGTMNNFDTISLHTLPHTRPVTELWPDLSREEQTRQHLHREQVARTNKGYAHALRDECGRYEFAGKAVAVPFVGAVAGSLVVAEVLRLLHEGVVVSDLKIRLGSIDTRSHVVRGMYGTGDLHGLGFCEAKMLEGSC